MTVAAIACALSLSLALLDSTIDILSLGEAFEFHFTHLGLGTAFFFGVYLLLWLAGRARNIEALPLVLAVSVLLTVGMTLDRVFRPDWFALDAVESLRQLAVLSTAVLCAVGIHALVQPLELVSSRFLSLLASAPFMLAELALFCGLGARSGTWVGAAAGAATMLVTGFCLMPFGTTRGLSRLLVACTLALIASPLVLLLPDGSRAQKHRSETSEPAVRRVILLSVDTLRADALSRAEGGKAATPNLAGLAKDSVVFTQALSPAPWTLPAVTSIMTGLAPRVHQAVSHASRVPDGVTTLAECLRNAGYVTAAIGKNPFLAAERNLTQGFDHYDFFPKPRPDPGRSVGSRLAQALKRSVRWTVSTDELTDLGIDWIESHRGQDFFLWLHYFDPHIDYAPPQAFQPPGEAPERIGRQFFRVEDVRGGSLVPRAEEKRWIRALYDGEVRYVDACVGRFLERLRSLGLYDETLIVFTSDHGEEFWEHGGFEHGHTLYQELLRVPLMVKAPASSSVPAREVPQVVGTTSLLATLLEMCELELPGPLSSPSLGPWFAGEPITPDPSLVSDSPLIYGRREAVVFDGLKYIRTLDSGAELLFDLALDPGELSSLAGARPESLRAARALLAEHGIRSEALRRHWGLGDDGERIELNAAARAQLKALGYVQ
jgi:arylsulfatase A-like enzyme